uniref:Uncharacterized protein n=1 Tax=Amphimedon queenslandica TaxID=400682 RepID=A0A1X7SZ32_AMPQE
AMCGLILVHVLRCTDSLRQRFTQLMKEYPDYADAEGNSQHVKQFQCVPDFAVGFLDVREQVEKCQRNSDDKPIVIH